jgi:transcriptional regulator with XRE-family HTH domain
MVNNKIANFGEMLRLQRVTMRLTLQQLSAKARVSPSHLGRIEKGTRFPSARVLKRLAKPLGYDEDQIFTLAGYLSSVPDGSTAKNDGHPNGQLDPYVGRMLAQEPIETQHAVIGILSMLKSIARGTNKPTDSKKPSKN